MKRPLRRMAAVLLCVLMCLGLALTVMGAAYAADDQPPAPGISIQVSLPDGWTVESAEESDSGAEAGNLSGGTEIYVNGKRYTTLSSGTLNVSLKTLGVSGSSEQTSAQEETVDTPDTNATAESEAADTSGTTAETPDTTAEQEAADTQDSATDPDAGTSDPDATRSSAGLTPDGQGTVVDNVSSETGKQFYTVYTEDESVFYLIIDNERDGDNVYLLDTVKESDLLSLTEKETEGGNDTTQSAIPDPEPVCICKDKCVPGEVDTNCPVCVLSWKDCAGTAATVEPEPTPEPKKDNSNMMILVVIAMAAVGGAGYYFKIYKPKKDLDDADDFDDLTDAEEQTVNEDEEPEEPTYPEGYGYGEPEDDM